MKKAGKKSTAKDIAILLAVWIPILFLIIGGMIWSDGGFEGMFMQELFPAIGMGLIFGFAAMLLLCPFMKNMFILLTGGLTIGLIVGVSKFLQSDTVYLTAIFAITAIFLVYGIIKLILIWLAPLFDKNKD